MDHKKPKSIHELQYTDGHAKMTGIVVSPQDVERKLPVVLVVHEMWGCTEHCVKRANKLADLGYIGIALDMYGEKPENIADAKRLYSELLETPGLMVKRFEAAIKAVESLPNTDTSRIAAIGYCMGGTVVVNIARTGVNKLRAVVSFHGGLSPLLDINSPIKTRILICHGCEDAFITNEQVDVISHEMRNATGFVEVIKYPNAKHGFTNPAADENAKKSGLPIGYDAAADQQSWQDMQTFFCKYL